MGKMREKWSKNDGEEAVPAVWRLAVLPVADVAEVVAAAVAEREGLGPERAVARGLGPKSLQPPRSVSRGRRRAAGILHHPP